MNASRRGVVGQSMLEFGLILPLLLLAVILFLELGRIVYYYTALNNAVREGARFAVVRPYNSNDERLAQIRQQVVGYAIGLPLASDAVNAYCDGNQSTTGDATCLHTITVAAQMDIAPMVAFSARILGAGTVYHLRAESTMQMTPLGACGDCNVP